MAQYCDSQALERNWYDWILSSSVPALEPHRISGVLWTKVLGKATHDGQVLLAHGKPLPDPSYHIRRHCLALETPLFFETQYGEVPELLTGTGKSLADPPKRIAVPFIETTKLTKSQDNMLFGELSAMGYSREAANNTSWHAMLDDIRKICNGITTKFHMRSEEEQQDLASDALLQITNKLVSGRLVYMPGRAPVFNLLTTTTYRIIYSILNKKNSHRDSVRKFIDDAAAGVLPAVGRSVRVPHVPQTRRPTSVLY